MYKTLFKTFFIILIASFVMLVLIPFVSYKIELNNLLSFIGYFYLTLFFIKFFGKKLSAKSVVLIIFATILLLQSYMIYSFVVVEIYGMPVVLGYCLGVISAYFYHTYEAPKNILPFALSSCFIAFMFFQGWIYWIHKSNHGTLTGKVTAYKSATKFEAFDEQKNLLSDVDFQNKIVLLDFWTTSCGVCFVKFPKLQNLYNQHKSDPAVKILAVNSPIEEDKPNQAFKMISERNYSFPVVTAKDETLSEKLGIKYYPTVFVLNKNGQIVYKGNIEGAIEIFEELRSNLR